MEGSGIIVKWSTRALDITRYRRWTALCLMVLLAGCARPIIPDTPEVVLAAAPYQIQHSPQIPLTPPANHSSLSLFNAGIRFTDWQGKDTFLGEVQPLFGRRCVSCHGCSDSPCQLKLSSFDMIRRGGTKINYYAPNLTEKPFPEARFDAPHFHTVLGNTSTGDAALEDALLYRFIDRGLRNTTDGDRAGAFDLDSIRGLQARYDKSAKYRCVANGPEFDKFITRNPGAGMPFGMPRLNDTEFATIKDWLARGSGGPDAEALMHLQSPSRPAVIATWEAFLNRDDNKSKLLARYLYEHLFSARLHFGEMPGEFYTLIRSRLPPGSEQLDEIITPLPHDDPGVTRVYYRLQKVTAMITQKDHVVWQVGGETLHYLQAHFISNAWQVADADIVLPDYQEKNPFSVFQQIPAVLRYRFLMENSKLFIESMVRASVCVGRSATYAISDHFWVFFLRPEVDVSSGSQFYRIGRKARDALDLETNRLMFLLQMEDRFFANKQYLEDYETALREELRAQAQAGLRSAPGLGLEDIWDGDGVNPNAWLRVLRHDASATVHYGQAGGFPQTIMVLNYANLERMYYNLVVNFKYWGDVKHKLSTWQSMSHERLEGEDLFISLLPEASRPAIRDLYVGDLELPAQFVTGLLGKHLVGKKIKKHTDLYSMLSGGRPALTGLPGRERADVELARMIRDRMAPAVRGPADDLNSRPEDGENIYLSEPLSPITIEPMSSLAEFENYVRRITADRGKGRYTPYLNGITLIRVGNARERQLYSLISNRGYFSHALVFAEAQERDPSRDTLSVYRGVIGDYPELFLDVPLEQAHEFLNRVQALSPKSYKEQLRSIRADFGIRRNSARFWPFVDWLHDWHVKSGDGYITAGILDLSKYDLYDSRQ